MNRSARSGITPLHIAIYNGNLCWTVPLQGNILLDPVSDIYVCCNTPITYLSLVDIANELGTRTVVDMLQNMSVCQVCQLDSRKKSMLITCSKMEQILLFVKFLH